VVVAPQLEGVWAVQVALSLRRRRRRQKATMHI